MAVRFDFYDGEAQIGGAEAIVHVAGDEITYIGGTYPVRSPIRARTAAGSIIAVEQVRSIVLDRLYEKGWNPDKPWTRHFQSAYHHGNPYDPVTEIKISLLIPHQGPDLVYDVDTTGAGYGFWVDAHTGKIVREESPQPDMGAGIP